MKRFTFITRPLSAVAVFAMVSGTGMFWSCGEDKIVERPIEVTILPTPGNPAAEAVSEDMAGFTWDRVEGAFGYIAELRLNPNGAIFSQAVIDDPVHDVTFTDLPSGTEYYFRVRATDRFSEGRNSFFTDWVKVTTDTVDPQLAQLETPRNVVNDSEQTTASSLRFRWDAVENAVSYTWQITPQAGGATRSGEVVGALSVVIDGLTPPGAAFNFRVCANPAEDSETHRSSAYSRALTARTTGVLASPVITWIEANTTVNELHFEWTAIEGAATYAFSVSEDGISYGADQETGHTGTVITGLTPNQTRWIRVKAQPVAGSVEYMASEYSLPVSGKTLAGSPLATPAPAQTASSYNSITVEWPAVANAAGYSYQVGDADPVEVAGLSVTLTFSTAAEAAAATSFRVMALAEPGSTTNSNSAFSPPLAISVAAARTAANVASQSEWDAAVAEMNVFGTGGTITITADGTYDLGGTLTLTNNFTIIGTGSGSGKTVFTGTKFVVGPGCASFTISDAALALTGNKVEMTSNLPAVTPPDITIRNCTSATAGKLLYNNADNSIMGNLLIDGVVADGLGADFIDLRKGGFTSLTVRNSTFANSAGGFLRADVVAGSTPVITINNNTFYKGMTGNGMLYVRIAASLTFRDNIVDLGGAAGLIGKNPTSPTSVSFSNNHFYTVPATGFWAATPYDEATVTGNGGSANAAAAPFANAATGDFTITDGALALTGAGDPRWIPAAP